MGKIIMIHKRYPMIPAYDNELGSSTGLLLVAVSNSFKLSYSAHLLPFSL